MRHTNRCAPPPARRSDPLMNLVVIVSDTLRRDHLGCYGNTWIRTPNLDRLARESLVLDRAYSCSFPTLPCRAEMFTGKFVFPYLNWGPLPQGEVVLSQVLADARYTCTIATDNPHMFRRGYWYTRGFHSCLRVRGQYHDDFQPSTREFQWPCPPEKLGKDDDGRLKQYLRSAAARESEEDWPAPQVAGAAVRWLEENHRRGPFFLHVDMFDPHEPFDPPREYADLYDPDGGGHDIIRPDFGSAAKYSAAELRRIRALYAGEVTQMDRCVGRIVEAIDALGHRDDTVVAFLSDHGILLGERGLLGKSDGKKESLRGWPLYPEISHVPMMYRVPGLRPGRRQAFAHPGDVGPTLLDFAGVKIPDTMRASSLAGVLWGEEERVRDVAVSSWSLRDWTPYRPSVIRTDEWSLVFWRAGIRPELYHLPSDPGETRDVFAENVGEARALHARYVQFLRENETPPKNFWPRRWLVTWGKPQSLLAAPQVAQSSVVSGEGSGAPYGAEGSGLGVQ
jgi:arylsulfatase A-like enzyme